MKKIIIGAILLAMLLLVSCSQKSTGDVMSPSFAPLEFTSVEEFQKSLIAAKNDEKSEFFTNYSLQIQEYNFKELSCYYVPAFLPEAAKLTFIRVKDSYVSLYYTLNIPLKDVESARDSGMIELLNTIIFKWSRYENGKELLTNTIEQQQLKRFNDNSDIYYSDVYYPADPGTLLGKQLFWLQDGYVFSLYLPLSEFSDDMVIQAKKVVLE